MKSTLTNIMTILLVTLVWPLSSGSAEKSPTPLPTVYLDLGNTLIDTTNAQHLTFMPGAAEYLESLQSRDFQLGIISNVPESWGQTHDEKVARLKQEIRKFWRAPQPFPWHFFSLILLPPLDKYRKPDPYLFVEALARGDYCTPYFLSEEGDEIDTARKVGINVYQVGRIGIEFFPPIEEVICIQSRNSLTGSHK